MFRANPRCGWCPGIDLIWSRSNVSMKADGWSTPDAEGPDSASLAVGRSLGGGAGDAGPGRLQEHRHSPVAAARAWVGVIGAMTVT